MSTCNRTRTRASLLRTASPVLPLNDQTCLIYAREARDATGRNVTGQRVQQLYLCSMPICSMAHGHGHGHVGMGIRIGVWPTWPTGAPRVRGNNVDAGPGV